MFKKIGGVVSMTAKRNKTAISILIISSVMLILVIILAALLTVKPTKDKTPVFSIKDNGGDWGTQGTIAVLDQTIKPGSEGKYEFVIKNDTNVELDYNFSIEEHYEKANDENEEAPSLSLQYRLKMNNSYLNSESEWKSASELNYTGLRFLQGSQQLMTLEWRWPFEGNDEEDTTLGKYPGTYSLVLNVEATIYESEQ